MATFSAYCRADTLAQLRTYARWRENADALTRAIPPQDGGGDPSIVQLGADDFVFLHDTFTVTEGIFNDEQVIFQDGTPDWVAFCHNQLGFDERGGADAAS